MEPFAKRQRLYSPVRRAFPQTFNDQNEYYDGTADGEILEDEDEDEDEFDEERQPLDADADLGQRRAQLDFKLKSTFEAIFDKYGKDFDGIGDEIDLATGEILVNNGHLMEMKNERDSGDSGRGRKPLRDVADELEDIPTSSLGDTNMLDEDEDDEGGEQDNTSDDDLVDDDMILRGFAQANRFVQTSPKLRARPQSIIPHQERHYPTEPRASIQGKLLPSRSEILAQFGPQLGPQIVEYVSERRVPDVSHIEAAWRAPELPISKPSKRPVARVFTLPLEPERPPSPEAATSIWAISKPRSRRRRDGADSTAIFRGESPASKKQHRSLSLDPLNDPVNFDISQSPHHRQTFTVQDNQILQAFIAQAKSQNLELLSKTTWVQLEHKYPHHTWSQWKEQYKLKFTYLWPTQIDESDVSTSEITIDTSRRIDQANSDLGHAHILPEAEIRPPLYDNPVRIRNPVENDTRIISWSQAVDPITTLDPDLHAGMMEDTTMIEAASRTDHDVSSSFGKDISLPNVRARGVHFSSHPRENRVTEPQTHSEVWSNSMDVEITPQPESSIPCALCPHADCRTFPTHLYRVQRKDDEDLSAMCLHLFHTHHTTPYPCSEPNCSRNGTEGFFMQTDLVRHVKIFHRSIGALQRLRGRVDEKLLSHHTRLGSSREEPSSQNRSLDKQVDSDLMSPSKVNNARFPSSNANSSSSSGADRTLTPRMTNGPSGASELTPMTSISSLMVHHSSGRVGLRDSYEYPEDSFIIHTAGSVKKNEFPLLESSIPENQRPQLQRSREFPDHAPEDSARGSLPTPQASSGGSLGPGTVFEKQDGFPSGRHETTTIMGRIPIRTRSPTAESVSTSISKPSIPSKIPDFQSSMCNIPSNTTPPYPEASTGRNAPASFFRNTIDASYEFSDEEESMATVLKPSTSAGAIPGSIMTPSEPYVVNPVVKENRPRAKSDIIEPAAADRSAPAKPVAVKLAVSEKKPRAKNVVVAKMPLAKSVAMKSTPPSKAASAATVSRSDAAEPAARGSKTKTKLARITPASRPFLGKSVIPNLLDDDEFDELSMTPDELVLLSSKPKSQPKAKIVAKTAAQKPGGTVAESSVQGKKRKLEDFQSDQASSSKPGLPKTTDPVIKSEVDGSTPTLPIQPKKKVRPRTVSNQQTLIVKPIPTKESFKATKVDENRGLRTKTPLLNLTPSRAAKHKTIGRDEISDSAAESSSPLAGFSTPVCSRRSLGDPLLSGQALPVVKTPGGTWRRCGEEGFKCQRSFCFRCVPKSAALKS